MSRHSTPRRTNKLRCGLWLAAMAVPPVILAGTAVAPTLETDSQSSSPSLSEAAAKKERGVPVADRRASRAARVEARGRTSVRSTPVVDAAPQVGEAPSAAPQIGEAPSAAAAEQPVVAEAQPQQPEISSTTSPSALPPATAGGEAVLGGSFPLLPSGSALPSDAECAARVQRDPWEPRPENAEENATRPTGPAPFGMASWTTAEADTATYRGRVTGNFTGTTDEIIQWASCKWGFPTDLNRAQAVIESTWDMSVAGDGGESRGLFQMKMTVWGGYPNSAASTAFNADWAMGLRRACYDGVMWYSELRGDLDACLGVHFSGDPNPTTWRFYVDDVRQMERTKPWLEWPSAAGAPPTADRGR